MVLPTLSVHLLGDFKVFCGETALTDRFKPRLQSLIAYLLLHRDTHVSRQQLAFRFWPDSAEAQARANLRKSVFRLRQIFPEVDDYLDLEGATISWRAGIPLRLDVAEFEQALEGAERTDVPQKESLLHSAVAVYKGELLPDLYDDWVLAARERLRRRYLHTLLALAKLLEQNRDYKTAIPLVRQLLREDPLVEEAYRHLMRLQALSGDVAGALRTYHRCVRELELDLGVEPAEVTQEAYRRLLDRSQPSKPAPAPHAPRLLPLVGREQVWQQLQETWRLASAGRPRMVVICGEAGIGKTRLAEELINWTDHQGMVSLSAACFTAEARLPLRPVADWLRTDAVRRALPQLAPRWRSEVARVLPELLAAEPQLEAPRPMTEAWQQQHFFMALVEAVTTAGDPLLLFLDDLHWADADTLDWLHFLAQQRGDYRFLLVGTARSEELTPDHPLPSWQQALARIMPVQQITLERLAPEATAALGSSVLGRSIEQETADFLHRETEGNPLFTVEIVRAGLERARGTLPEKVRSVIEIRLSRLSPPAQELAALAAVIGRRFAFPLLEAASPQGERELLDSLDELWQRQIVREQGEDGYDFAHGKIREVALGRLGLARRRWWHRRVAQALEQLGAGQRESAHGQIAAHWEAAGDQRKAAVHYLQAAQAASRLYAHEEAIAHLQQALALLPENDARHSELYAQMGEAFLAQGQFSEAAANFEAAANTAQKVAEKVNLLTRRVLSLNGGRQFAEAKATYQKGLSLMEPVSDGEAEGRRRRAWIDLHLSFLDMLYFTNESDEMERVCGVMTAPVEAYGTTSQRAWYLAAVSRMRARNLRYRLTDEDVADRQAALQWAKETEDDSLIVDHQFGLGFTLLWAGHPATAIDELQQAMAQAEELGNIPLKIRCLAYLGIAYRMVGDQARVREVVEEMATVTGASGNQFYLGVAEALRAWLLWRAGDIEAAERYGRAALRQLEAATAPYPMQWLARLPLLAIALTQRDSTVDAREEARAMLLPSQQQLPDPLADAVQALAAADTASAVAKHLQEACTLAREHGYL